MAQPLSPGLPSASATTDGGLPSPGPSGGLDPLILAGLVSLWLAGPANLALWQALMDLPGRGGPRALIFAFGFGLIVAAATLLLLAPFAWRRTIKPVAIVLLAMAAFAAHFMTLYGVVIDSTMIVNVLHTDARETRDLLNLRLLGFVLVLAVVPSVLVMKARLAVTRPMRQLLRIALTLVASVAVIVALVILGYQDLSSTMRNHKHVRYLINPLNSVYALVDVGIVTPLRRQRKLLPYGEDAKLGATHTAGGRPPVVLLVVGETARAANFSLNGYARMTNPLLARENVVSWRQVRSCGTSTAASLPCMFSGLGRTAFESRDNDHENLLDVLQRAGLAVLWLDNQAGCKGLCDRVPSANTSQLQVAGLCGSDERNRECQDGVLVHELDARIAQLPAERRARGVVVVLHQMGSHGPAYYKRSPESVKAFRPECATNVLQDCPREHVVNAYDNSILYTDSVLASAIAWLKQREAQAATALLYVSDHGESLGENNIYLHGLPYAFAPQVQTHVPMITWLSAAYEQRLRVSTACLASRRDEPLSHDHLFHSMLGLLDVSTSVYRRELDLFAPCVGK